MMYFMTKKMIRTMMTKRIMIMCRALGRKGAHLPFRASKLTQVLRDSFIGDKVNIIPIFIPTNKNSIIVKRIVTN